MTSPTTHKRPAEERLWEKVEGRDLDECWMWTGMVIPNGYGQIRVGYGSERRTSYPHRLIAEWAGLEPAGKHVHHVCGRKLCCNPLHLEVVNNLTHQEQHAPYSRADVERVRERLENGERVTALARELGVSHATVSRWKSRTRWP